MNVSEDFAWEAFMRRDRRHDGQFIGAVKTTGIYCKPSCAARHPLRRNVEFFTTAAEARAAGYRACLRCKPDEVGRDREAVAAALKLLDEGETSPSLGALANSVGYAPHHFHRLFKRDTGVTPAAYARALQAKRAAAALDAKGSIIDAIYEAGYSGPSRFYANTKAHLGMTPSAWRNGGSGVTIRWATVETPLGQMLLAATDKGICRLSFDENERVLVQRFPKANIIAGGAALENLVTGALAAIAHPAEMPDLPLDIAGTAFQQAIWNELKRIPPGETRTYAEMAAAVGKPKAIRAAGTANGANNVAVLIPCHRVIRTDGTMGGYAYGIHRKEKLLQLESES